MKLKYLHIFSVCADGPLNGAIEFYGAHGEIKLSLKQEHIAGLLSVMAEGIVAAAREVAQDLTAETIEQAQNRLEDKG